MRSPEKMKCILPFPSLCFCHLFYFTYIIIFSRHGYCYFKQQHPFISPVSLPFFMLWILSSDSRLLLSIIFLHCAEHALVFFVLQVYWQWVISRLYVSKTIPMPTLFWRIFARYWSQGEIKSFVSLNILKISVLVFWFL